MEPACLIISLLCELLDAGFMMICSLTLIAHVLFKIKPLFVKQG